MLVLLMTLDEPVVDAIIMMMSIGLLAFMIQHQYPAAIAQIARTLRTRKVKKAVRVQVDSVLRNVSQGIERAVSSFNIDNYNVKQQFQRAKSSNCRAYTSRGIYTKRLGKGYKPFLLMAAIQVQSTPMYSPPQPKLSIPSPVSLKNQSNELFHSNCYHEETVMNDEYVCYHALEEYDAHELVCFSNEISPRVTQHFGVPTLQFDSDSFPIGIDTFASACMSPQITDFVPGTLRALPTAKSVTAYGKDGPRISVTMKGTLKWVIEDNDGRIHDFRIEDSLYVPDGNMRLLSPQHWANSSYLQEGNQKVRCNINHKGSMQFWNRNVLRWGTNGQFTRTIFNNKRSRVPVLYTSPTTEQFTKYQAKVRDNIDMSYLTCFEATVSDDEDPDSHSPHHTHEECEVEPVNFIFSTHPMTSAGEKHSDKEQLLTAVSDRAELMRWHLRLGHLSFPRLKDLAEKGIIPRRLAMVRAPKCAGCIYGRMTKRPRSKRKLQGKIKIAEKPGECVSVDQMESSSSGFIGQMKGRLTKKRYKYATVFVDHYTRYTYVHLQTALTSEETVEAKQAFETHMRSMGVHVAAYHADNGRFADNAFLRAIKQQGQNISFCGVNAHFQNGIAERMIRTLRDSARTQLLHCIERWPTVNSVHLWPYALVHAANVQNQLPKMGETVSPIAKISGSEVQPNLNHIHTFGCPVYALDNRLQAGQQIKHWSPRARLGVYLGPSPKHARTVSLVMNPNTGLVLPQFHVQHDEFFETVQRERRQPMAPWLNISGLRKQGVALGERARGSNDVEPNIPNSERNITREVAWGDVTEEPNQEQEATQEEEGLQETDNDETQVHQQPSISRSGRVRTPSIRLRESEQAGNFDYTSFKATVPNQSDEDYYYMMMEKDLRAQDRMSDPIAFKATADPDTMYYHQAMKEPDREQFLAAIVKEVNAHIEGNHWEMIHVSEVPEGEKILDSVWAMKRKRDIKTQQVYKHKARLNIHGGQQEFGIHYTDTYSPVVSWFAVRLILIIAKLAGYRTRQIDFVLAYPQADIPYDNYMHLPHGVKSSTGKRGYHVLKLKKNIYGGRNSGRVWYDYLREGLENIGFEKSQVDDCVFYRGDVLFFFYVDDGIFVSKDEAQIDEAIADLRNKKKAKNKYNIDDQGEITDYLGINFGEDEQGRLKLWQPHLIDQLVEETGIDNRCKVKPTPAASTKPLRRHKSEPDAKCPFHYRRVIGKLNYLEKSSRPDIAYAVHQCARFCENPKQQHVDAVLHLVKYLKGTRSEGMYLHPKADRSFEVWVDADFSGNYDKITAQSDPSTAKSRSGFVITYAGCPIQWTSKLQTQIALSTCEAEYISLSQSLREAMPLMNLAQELKDHGFKCEFTKPKVKCRVFEDNTGALALAKVPKIRPRTKHINLVYHHFREAVRDGRIDIEHVNTEEQIADIFTKPLPQNLFLKFRRKLMFW